MSVRKKIFYVEGECMSFFAKNQFKIAIITVLFLVVVVLAFVLIPKTRKCSSDFVYYKVNFDGVEDDYISNQVVLEGGKINEPKEPVKDGFIFLGWFLGEEKYDFSKNIFEDLNIEAKWKKDGEEEIVEEVKPAENNKPTTNNGGNNSNNNNNNGNSSSGNNQSSSNNNNNKPVVSDKVAVTSITLNKTNLTFEIGQSDTLVATVNPDNATDKNVTWASSNNSVVTVNGGVVSAVGAGSATITATAGGKSVSCNVVVNKKITYSYEWQRIESSSVGEYYLFIVSSEGNKVSGMVNVIYSNGKSKEQSVPASGLKLIKSAVSSVEIITAN
jgi:hypothetical protein